MNTSFALPSKLFIEPTTRCNFKCGMCVKQADANEIVEGDLTVDIFEKLIPTFNQLDTLIFSGIGEPLLNTNLEEFIKLAKNQVPKSCKIGLQSNGSLLTEKRLQRLVSAGLDVICVSFDAIAPDCFQEVREGGEVELVKKALRAIQEYNKSNDRILQFGIEFVLMKSNHQDLLDVIRWSAHNGASFAIVTHVLPYSKEMEAQQLNSLNLNISHKLYESYRKKASEQGLDLDYYLKNRWRVKWNTNKNEEEKILQELGEELVEKGYSEKIPLHFENLINEDETGIRRIELLFNEAEKLADQLEIKLTLPELYPRYDRKCHFVEEKSAFVSWDGQVYPCYYLWHQYGHFLNGMRQRVAATSMGKLSEKNMVEVWNDPGYERFRKSVLEYDYPYCGSCMLSPCNLFTEKKFEYDCYAKDIPCGGCPWCGGLMNCLQ